MKIRPVDKAFSTYIRTRDKWTCQRCGKYHEPPTQALHCSHFQGRRKESTRFDELNADALCHGCHRYFTSHPAEHTEWQIERKGKEVVDKLVVRSNMYKKKDVKLMTLYWKKRLYDDYGIRA